MTGRKTELNNLEQLYKESGNQLLVLYGRKEYGMHSLLREFLKGKRTFCYHAPELSAEAQKKRMGQEISQQYDVAFSNLSYEAFFRHLKSKDGSKLVVVIDEFDHVVKRDSSFMEAVKKLKEKKLYPGPVMILLCCTRTVWVEQDMPKLLGPIGRKLNRIIKLKEEKFVDLVKYFPEYSVSQCVEVYGVTGGIQEYWKHWDAKADLRTNVCRNILSEDGFLYQQAEWIINGQLREPSVYHTILQAVAAGKIKLNDLYLETGFSRAKISVYLKNLMELDIVEKVFSMETGGWENAKKGLYQIKDTFINFWFKFVFPHLSKLYVMEPEEFYDTYIADELEAYLSRYFQKVCREYLELMDKIHKLPIEIHKIGTWIGKKGCIDIIAQNSIRENLICMCNWEKPAMTFEMCQELFASMEQAKVTASYYYLFSAKGFDEKLKKMVAADSRIKLVDMNQM